MIKYNLMVENLNYRKLYLSLLSATGFFLPLSVWMLTFFIIILVIIWIADGGIKKLPQLINDKRKILVFCIFYLVYLVWMIKTSDISNGFWELKVKLPFLIFPIVIGLSEPLNQREVRILISFFITGVTISTVAGVIFKYKSVLSGLSDTREISLFIPHVRLALMSVFAIFCSAWYFFSSVDRRKPWHYCYLAAALWLTVFLFILLSLTGILIFASVMTLSVIYIVLSDKGRLVKYSLVTFWIVLLVVTAIYIVNEFNSFYKKGNAYPVPLEQLTANGNIYKHFPEIKDTENGNKVWLYINEDELKKEWNSRSDILYDSLDRKGQKLRNTLIRYLTSAGLRKDSLGASCLNTRDISNIENGIANILYTEGKPIRSKIYEIIWQIDYYRNGGNPSGHSVTQRMEFLKTGWNVFLRAPLFGTGTGDLDKEYELQYKLDKSILDLNYRYQSHNQYLTFLISFGLFGFFLICVSLILPVIRSKGLKNYTTVVFFVIFFLAMLGEDTLETHTGISFFAYFYSLFIFGNSDE
jgi:ABC-type multidrug transport system fused ATPase/permease subunit